MRKVAASLTVLFVLWAAPSFAQRTTASIRGTVTDSTGGVVPGANVTVKGEDTGLTRTTVTNAPGRVLLRGAAGRHATPSRSRSADSSPRSRRASRSTSPTPARSTSSSRPGALTETVTVESSHRGEDRRRRSGRPRHRRAGARAAAQRPQLPAARHADAGRQRGRRLQHQGPGPDVGHRALGQRQRPRRQHVDGRRRQQQRRRIEPHDPRLPLGRRDRRVQGPPQQLRRRVRRRGRRADQHRHPRGHERVPRQRLLLRPQRRAGLDGLLPRAGRTSRRDR